MPDSDTQNGNTKVLIDGLQVHAKEILKEVLRRVPRGSDEDTLMAKQVLSRLIGCDPETFADQPAHQPFKDAKQLCRQATPLVKALKNEHSKNKAIKQAVLSFKSSNWGGHNPEGKQLNMSAIAAEITALCTSAGVALFPPPPVAGAAVVPGGGR